MPSDYPVIAWSKIGQTSAFGYSVNIAADKITSISFVEWVFTSSLGNHWAITLTLHKNFKFHELIKFWLLHSVQWDLKTQAKTLCFVPIYYLKFRYIFTPLTNLQIWEDVSFKI